MTQLAAQAARTPGFNEIALRQTLRAIAARAHATEDDVFQAISAGWTQGVKHAMSDGILTQQEENQLRRFRDQLVSGDNPLVSQGLSTLDREAGNRLMMDARTAAMDTQDGEARLQDLQNNLRQARLPPERRQRILVQAWETIEDGAMTLDEENALDRYLDHFGISTGEANANGTHTSLVQAAVIQDVTQGIVPQRQNINAPVPFNLMKSEQLVWVIQDVDYLETVVRGERRGTSHGVSIPIGGIGR